VQRGVQIGKGQAERGHRGHERVQWPLDVEMRDGLQVEDLLAAVLGLADVHTHRCPGGEVAGVEQHQEPQLDGPANR
jgi:hypothetical protein